MTATLLLLLATVPAAPDTDGKPTVAIVSAEDEYKTETTLPAFAVKYLPGYAATLILADPKDKNHLPDIGKLKDADLLILSVRRRPLRDADLEAIKQYVKSKKPIVAIRTSSHAFAPKKGEKLPPGVTAWETFDQDILGCHYTGHYPNTVKTAVTLAAKDHDALKGVAPFTSTSWLYKSSPLAKDCTVLLTGQAGTNPPEPAAWVRPKSDTHGNVFYTCLGHPDDFKQPSFVALLKNAIGWATK